MSTTDYFAYPIETDSSVLAKDAIQQLMSLQPGFVPNESNLEVAILEVAASMNAETRYVAGIVTAEIYRYVGKSLFNIPAIDGAPATTTSTWTMRDTAGYTIPANTLVAYSVSGSTTLYFRTQADVSVPPGSQSTTTGEVTLVATEYGETYNDLPAQPVSIVDSLAFVLTVETEDATSGGVDAETADAYLNRLRTELRLLSPRPILAQDFAALALNVAGVSRAVAIDNYNPNDLTFDNERMVAVAVADVDGQGLSSFTKDNVKAYLEALRELNFVVNVIDPTYLAIDVIATLKVLPGYDPGSVQAAAVSAIQGYLNPASWDWSTVVRANELIGLLSAVSGVDYVDALVEPNYNVELPGVAALVSAGVVSISTV